MLSKLLNLFLVMFVSRSCLNPYSTGRYSLILHRLKDSVLADLSLNPYSTGRYSLSDKKHFEDFSVRAS